jgi:hypothetical protein
MKTYEGLSDRSKKGMEEAFREEAATMNEKD